MTTTKKKKKNDDYYYDNYHYYDDGSIIFSSKSASARSLRKPLNSSRSLENTKTYYSIGASGKDVPSRSNFREDFSWTLSADENLSPNGSRTYQRTTKACPAVLRKDTHSLNARVKRIYREPLSKFPASNSVNESNILREINSVEANQNRSAKTSTAVTPSSSFLSSSAAGWRRRNKERNDDTIDRGFTNSWSRRTNEKAKSTTLPTMGRVTNKSTNSRPIFGKVNLLTDSSDSSRDKGDTNDEQIVTRFELIEIYRDEDGNEDSSRTDAARNEDRRCPRSGRYTVSRDKPNAQCLRNDLFLNHFDDEEKEVKEIKRKEEVLDNDANKSARNLPHAFSLDSIETIENHDNDGDDDDNDDGDNGEGNNPCSSAKNGKEFVQSWKDINDEHLDRKDFDDPAMMKVENDFVVSITNLDKMRDSCSKQTRIHRAPRPVASHSSPLTRDRESPEFNRQSYSRKLDLRGTKLLKDEAVAPFDRETTYELEKSSFRRENLEVANESKENVPTIGSCFIVRPDTPRPDSTGDSVERNFVNEKEDSNEESDDHDTITISRKESSLANVYNGDNECKQANILDGTVTLDRKESGRSIDTVEQSKNFLLPRQDIHNHIYLSSVCMEPFLGLPMSHLLVSTHEKDSKKNRERSNDRSHATSIALARNRATSRRAPKRLVCPVRRRTHQKDLPRVKNKNRVLVTRLRHREDACDNLEVADSSTMMGEIEEGNRDDGNAMIEPMSIVLNVLRKIEDHFVEVCQAMEQLRKRFGKMIENYPALDVSWMKKGLNIHRGIIARCENHIDKCCDTQNAVSHINKVLSKNVRKLQRVVKQQMAYIHKQENFSRICKDFNEKRQDLTNVYSWKNRVSLFLDKIQFTLHKGSLEIIRLLHCISRSTDSVCFLTENKENVGDGRPQETYETKNMSRDSKQQRQNDQNNSPRQDRLTRVASIETQIGISNKSNETTSAVVPKTTAKNTNTFENCEREKITSKDNENTNIKENSAWKTRKQVARNSAPIEMPNETVDTKDNFEKRRVEVPNAAGKSSDQDACATKKLNRMQALVDRMKQFKSSRKYHPPNNVQPVWKPGGTIKSLAPCNSTAKLGVDRNKRHTFQPTTTKNKPRDLSAVTQCTRVSLVKHFNPSEPVICKKTANKNDRISCQPRKENMPKLLNTEAKVKQERKFKSNAIKSSVTRTRSMMKIPTSSNVSIPFSYNTRRQEILSSKKNEIQLIVKGSSLVPQINASKAASQEINALGHEIRTLVAESYELPEPKPKEISLITEPLCTTVELLPDSETTNNCEDHCETLVTPATTIALDTLTNSTKDDSAIKESKVGKSEAITDLDSLTKEKKNLEESQVETIFIKMEDTSEQLFVLKPSDSPVNANSVQIVDPSPLESDETSLMPKTSANCDSPDDDKNSHVEVHDTVNKVPSVAVRNKDESLPEETHFTQPKSDVEAKKSEKCFANKHARSLSLLKDFLQYQGIEKRLLNRSEENFKLNQEKNPTMPSIDEAGETLLNKLEHILESDEEEQAKDAIDLHKTASRSSFDDAIPKGIVIATQTPTETAEIARIDSNPMKSQILDHSASSRSTREVGTETSPGLQRSVETQTKFTLENDVVDYAPLDFTKSKRQFVDTYTETDDVSSVSNLAVTEHLDTAREPRENKKFLQDDACQTTELQFLKDYSQNYTPYVMGSNRTNGERKVADVCCSAIFSTDECDSRRSSLVPLTDNEDESKEVGRTRSAIEGRRMIDLYFRDAMRKENRRFDAEHENEVEKKAAEQRTKIDESTNTMSRRIDSSTQSKYERSNNDTEGNAHDFSSRSKEPLVRTNRGISIDADKMEEMLLCGRMTRVSRKSSPIFSNPNSISSLRRRSDGKTRNRKKRRFYEVSMLSTTTSMSSSSSSSSSSLNALERGGTRVLEKRSGEVIRKADRSNKNTVSSDVVNAFQSVARYVQNLYEAVRIYKEHDLNSRQWQEPREVGNAQEDRSNREMYDEFVTFLRSKEDKILPLSKGEQEEREDVLKERQRRNERVEDEKRIDSKSNKDVTRVVKRNGDDWNSPESLKASTPNASSRSVNPRRDLVDGERSDSRIASSSSSLRFEVDALLKRLVQRVEEEEDDDGDDKLDETRRLVRRACKIDRVEKTASESSSNAIVSRETLLPLVYGIVCTIVFWCLQFSMSYEV